MKDYRISYTVGDKTQLFELKISPKKLPEVVLSAISTDIEKRGLSGKLGYWNYVAL